ncbi:hypothetical protein EON81_24950 [bacterium]|nr:MAG: hypothetical protein EON81_24950 [bacterium]
MLSPYVEHPEKRCPTSSQRTQLPQVARDFKIFYKKVDGKTPGSYTMDHSAGSYVFDPKGQIRLYNRYGSGPVGLTADVKALLKGA